MIGIGQQFPSITTTAAMPDGSFDENFNPVEYAKGSTTVVFFWPLDFTFVCPTEIVAFDKAMDEFTAKGVKVIGASIDSHFTHAAWKNTPLNQGGIGNVQFPMMSDMNKSFGSRLGILNEGGVCYRASYLLDKEGNVRHFVVNDLPLGRSVQEMLRMVDALQHFEAHGEVCPANWKSGETAMKANKDSTSAYLANKHGQAATKAA